MSTTTSSQDELRAPALAPVLPARFALQLKQLLVCLGVAAFFMYLNYIPLFHSDIWGHVHYGKWILEHRALPLEDPFTPLAQGVPVVDTAWLGQVLFALAERWGGAEWMSDLYALTGLATYLLLARAFFLRTRMLGPSFLGCVIVWIVGMTRHAVVRPEIFGGFCFALLLWLVARIEAVLLLAEAENEAGGPIPAPGWRNLLRREPLSLWLGAPLLFAAWANLHGSFIVGIAVLGCTFLGRVVEVAWRTRNLETVLSDAGVRRWLLVTELAAAAALINPYGIDLYFNVMQFSKNENLKDVLEWFPLKLTDYEGLHFSFSIILLTVLLRHSRQRVRPADVLLLGVFAVSVAPTIRMLGWYAPVFAYVIVPHLADVTRRLWAACAADTDVETRLSTRSFRYSTFSLLALWLGFAFSPTSSVVLGGTPRKPEALYSRGTPLGVTKYLREHPPQGQIWNPQWWGDWLAWDGPPGIQVFMTTNAVHVAPRRVWRDYMNVAHVLAGWDRTLDRYHVDTIVIHKELQDPLLRAVRRLSGWKVVYEDEVGVVATRTEAKST